MKESKKMKLTDIYQYISNMEEGEIEFLQEGYTDLDFVVRFKDGFVFIISIWEDRTALRPSFNLTWTSKVSSGLIGVDRLSDKAKQNIEFIRSMKEL